MWKYWGGWGTAEMCGPVAPPQTESPYSDALKFYLSIYIYHLYLGGGNIATRSACTMGEWVLFIWRLIAHFCSLHASSHCCYDIKTSKQIIKNQISCVITAAEIIERAQLYAITLWDQELVYKVLTAPSKWTQNLKQWVPYRWGCDGGRERLLIISKGNLASERDNTHSRNRLQGHSDRRDSSCSNTLPLLPVECCETAAMLDFHWTSRQELESVISHRKHRKMPCIKVTL